MRFGAVSTITLLSAVGFLACFPNSPMKEPLVGGGEAGNGAASASGGAQSAGGTAGASGGETSSGGSGAPGGATSSGAAAGSGGSATSPVSGGAGGSTGSGASSSPGGSGGSGGTKSSGGAAAAGGVRGSGGITASAGGSGGGGACTDDPPPNQTPTCAEWVSYSVCSQDWFKTYCDRSCGRCSGTSGSGGISSSGGSSNRGGAGGSGGAGGASGKGGSTGGGGSTGPGSTNPPISGGSNGWATRYWDCCKPSCSWTTNVPSCQKDGSTRITDKNAKSGCEGGSAFECYDFAPWYDAGTNMSYGFAAKNGVNCGTCFILQFTGEGNSGPNAGAAALKGQQMIVQAINIGGIDSNQFDLLIPGGGVGAMNGCATQWGSSTDLGAQYGGLLTNCKGDATCMKGKCQSVFGNMPALLAGCNWFTGWFSSADNPKLIYKQTSCPSQLTSKSGISG
jgi:hypothetical protein